MIVIILCKRNKLIKYTLQNKSHRKNSCDRLGCKDSLHYRALFTVAINLQKNVKIANAQLIASTNIL